MSLKVPSNSPDMFIRAFNMRLTSTGIVCGLSNQPADGTSVRLVRV